MTKSGAVGDLKDTGQTKLKHSSSSGPVITPVVKPVSGRTILVPGIAPDKLMTAQMSFLALLMTRTQLIFSFQRGQLDHSLMALGPKGVTVGSADTLPINVYQQNGQGLVT